MRGLLGRKSIPSATRVMVNDWRSTLKKAAAYAAHTSSVIWLTRPRAPLVPNATPLRCIISRMIIVFNCRTPVFLSVGILP